MIGRHKPVRTPRLHREETAQGPGRAGVSARSDLQAATWGAVVVHGVWSYARLGRKGEPIYGGFHVTPIPRRVGDQRERLERWHASWFGAKSDQSPPLLDSAALLSEDELQRGDIGDGLAQSMAHVGVGCFDLVDSKPFTAAIRIVLHACRPASKFLASHVAAVDRKDSGRWAVRKRRTAIHRRGGGQRFHI